MLNDALTTRLLPLTLILPFYSNPTCQFAWEGLQPVRLAKQTSMSVKADISSRHSTQSLPCKNICISLFNSKIVSLKNVFDV